VDIDDDDGEVNIQNDFPERLQLLVTASDGSLTDNQIVRVVVDQIGGDGIFEVESSYFESSSYRLIFTDDDDGIQRPIISLEDPFSVDAPTISQLDSSQDDIEERRFLSLPGFSEPIDIRDHDSFFVLLASATESPQLKSTFDEYTPHDLLQGSPISSISLGEQELTLTTRRQYPGETSIEGEARLPVYVAECIPYRNDNAGSYVPGVNDRVGNLNPFLYDHACCEGEIDENPNSWEIEDNGKVCYRDEETISCDGNANWEIDSTTSHNIDEGYVQEQKVYLCDGVRGNVCGINDDHRKIQLVLRDGYPVCGVAGCNNVNNQCQDKVSWSYFDTNDDDDPDAWCMGYMGCDVFCDKPPAVTRAVKDEIDELRRELDDEFPSQYILTEYQKQKGPETVSGIFCGCDSSRTDDTPYCDYDFSGEFNGVCTSSGACTSSRISW
jgi:hypothetical protein